MSLAIMTMKIFMTKIPPPPKKSKLHMREEIFCQLYAGYGDRSFMNNGVMSYIAAWGIETPTHRVQITKGKLKYWDYAPKYKVAKTQAHYLLTRADIRVRIHSLFKILFSADTVDSELLAVIKQDLDPKAKVMAIKEFNELKGRITKKLKLSGELKSNLPENRLAEVAQYVLKKSKEKK